MKGSSVTVVREGLDVGEGVALAEGVDDAGGGVDVSEVGLGDAGPPGVAHAERPSSPTTAAVASTRRGRREGRGTTASMRCFTGSL